MWPFGKSRRSDGLGGRGEKLAHRLLRRRGMKILARNYRCPAGEADIIILDRSTRNDLGAETIALVEVKTRSSNRYTEPEAAVDADKQRRLRKIADYYLSGRDAHGYNIRFDIVSITAPPGEKPQMRYLQNAF